MFYQLFTSPRAIDRHSKSPLLEERLSYLARCAAHGSTRSSLRLIAQHLCKFACNNDPLRGGFASNSDPLIR